jgi:hypothetical protein
MYKSHLTALHILYKIHCFMCKIISGGKRWKLQRVVIVCLFWRTTRMYTMAMATFCWRNPINGNQMTEFTLCLSCSSGHQPRNALHAVTTKQRLLKGINIDPSFDFNHMINTENWNHVWRTKSWQVSVWSIQHHLSQIMLCFNMSVSHHCHLTQVFIFGHRIHLNDRGTQCLKC